MSYAAYRRDRFLSTIWRDIKSAWSRNSQALLDWYNLQA